MDFKKQAQKVKLNHLAVALVFLAAGAGFTVLTVLGTATAKIIFTVCHVIFIYAFCSSYALFPELPISR